MALSSGAAANPGQADIIQQAGSSGPAEAVPTVSAADYAGFWKRLAAAIIDFGVLLLVGFSLAIIVPILAAQVVGLPGDSYIMGSFIAFWLIIPWLYYSLTESSSRQATPGKSTIGIMVTDTVGKRISFGRATERYWGKIVSLLILFAGFIMVGFTVRKQGLHDILAQCLVVTRK